MIEGFVALPFLVRVALTLFILIVVFWMIFGRFVLWFLSAIPYLVRVIFRGVYFVIELPVSTLHKKFGLSFYEVDNHLSLLGKKTDEVLSRWYSAWHSPAKINFGRCLLLYVACVIFVTVPAYLKTNSSILKFGETTFAHYEENLINWFIMNEWYDPETVAASNQDEKEEQVPDVVIETEPFEAKLIVSGVDESLLVRNKPSTKAGEILERLKNGDRVKWNGKMLFAKAENDHVEPWVKIVTKDGVEGWCRLFYLYPKGFKTKEFQVTGSSRGAIQ